MKRQTQWIVLGVLLVVLLVTVYFMYLKGDSSGERGPDARAERTVHPAQCG